MVGYVQVILPLAIPDTFTYRVPSAFCNKVEVGMRIEVAFGSSKRYAGIVLSTSLNNESDFTCKDIIGVLDEEPIVTKEQLVLWRWIATYYACTLGEVMVASIPSALRLVSESRVVKGTQYKDSQWDLDDKSYLIHEALQHNPFLTIQDVQDILQIQTVMPMIHRLIQKGIVTIEESLQEKYKIRTETCIRFLPPFNEKAHYNKAFKLVERAPKQQEVLLALISTLNRHEHAIKTKVQEAANTSSSVVNALIDKQIIESYELQASRIQSYHHYKEKIFYSLSPAQVDALENIHATVEKRRTTLLYGNTGSGKTEIYCSYIKEHVVHDAQVLYLVPEIALTTQLTQRLASIFGEELIVYHSRLNNQERVEIWNAILKNEKRIIVGARSSILLPFAQLGLIIIDEEHDYSYKQQDPAPRYHARDVAIYAAHRIWNCQVILGSATPSIETYYNALSESYGYVRLEERYGNAELPQIKVTNMKRLGNGSMPVINSIMRESIKNTLEAGQQIILFKNRRGYAPRYQCSECDWHAECQHCDVSLTYHQSAFRLQCHYCGYYEYPKQECPECGSTVLKNNGIGTEKIEEEISLIFPEHRVGRLDADTTKGKYAMAQIVSDFQLGKMDILVGTQMISKGLDFKNVTLVGVIDVESIFQFPDFRSNERSFQLLKQVSGRSGRGENPGIVLIQAKYGRHPVLEYILNGDNDAFYSGEIEQRKKFLYPPFVRLINIHFEHQKVEKVRKAAQFVYDTLHKQLKKGVLGPTPSRIPRLKNRYRFDIFLKLQNEPRHLDNIKQFCLALIGHTRNQEGMSGVRIFLDVDPL